MAPYEANAQLPWLPRLDPIMGGVSALISKDNDLIAYCSIQDGTDMTMEKRSGSWDALFSPEPETTQESAILQVHR
ncbi:unnamed protein product [Sphagnum jensenii]|uniref:Uncharacterized protein n=1 Tax=Sphagnum jensenii TaxID=128206 RepID=A0ABP0W462_9BRYO